MARVAEDFLLRRYPNSPYWYYRFKGQKSFQSTGLKTKSAAKSFAIQKINDLKEKGPRILFKDYADNFFGESSPWSRRQLQRGRLLPSTIEWRKTLFNKHIKMRFANYYLDEITPSIIDDYLLSLDCAGRTKNHIRSTMNIVFKEAIRDRRIKDNPVSHVEKLPENDSTSNEPPTMSEMLELFPDSKEEYIKLWPSIHYGIMCEITATAGLRMQEVRALTPKAIHFEKAGIVITQAVKSDNSIGLPKAKEIRVVLVPQRTLARVKWWIKEKNINDDALLFPGRTGEPIDRKSPYKYFNIALGKAMVEKNGRKLTAHGLRHAFNTRMREILSEAAIEGFWDEDEMCFANKLKSADEILREYTGHRSKAMTDLYDHPDLLKKLDAFQPFKIYTEKFWDE